MAPCGLGRPPPAHLASQATSLLSDEEGSRCSQQWRHQHGLPGGVAARGPGGTGDRGWSRPGRLAVLGGQRIACTSRQGPEPSPALSLEPIALPPWAPGGSSSTARLGQGRVAGTHVPARALASTDSAGSSGHHTSSLPVPAVAGILRGQYRRLDVSLTQFMGLNPQGDGVRGWGLWEAMRSQGWSLVMESVTLGKGPQRTTTTPHVRTHADQPSVQQEVSSPQTLEPGLGRGPPASRAARNKLLLSRSHPDSATPSQQPRGTETIGMWKSVLAKRRHKVPV